MKIRVTYSGFLQTVTRDFPTLERAEQWARQAGVFARATFAPPPHTMTTAQIAAVIAALPDHAPTLRSAKQSVTNAFAAALAELNPAFKEAKFRRTCGDLDWRAAHGGERTPLDLNPHLHD